MHTFSSSPVAHAPTRPQWIGRKGMGTDSERRPRCAIFVGIPTPPIQVLVTDIVMPHVRSELAKRLKAPHP